LSSKKHELPATGIRGTIMPMKPLWAPWRMRYLEGKEPLPEGCLFCVKQQMEDKQAHILHRGRCCYVILNRYPYNNGHMMVVPYAHLARMVDVDPQTLDEMMTLTQLSLRVLREAYRAEGFNIGMNIGKAAGAGVADHLHLHIVPRWAGDTNYMTIVGETRVLPEGLEQTYERLQPLFQELRGQESE